MKDGNGDCCLCRVDWKIAKAPQRATRDRAPALLRVIDGDMVIVCCAELNYEGIFVM